MAKLSLVSGSNSETLSTNLYDRIRADVLAGALEPGRKLQIEFVCERYGAGQTPVREALNRLTSDGLIERREQRGFAVTTISAEDLREITKTRCWLEAVGLRESIAKKSDEWEEALVLAHHRLTKTPRFLGEELDPNPEWEELHHAFHRALISGCDSKWLMGFCDQLSEQLTRYRQLSTRRIYPKRFERGEHSDIIDAVIAGDADKAVALLTSHYEETASIILSDEKLFS